MAARLLRLWVRIPQGTWMCVSCEYSVMSDRCSCDEMIIGPEKSYQQCCVVICDLESSRVRPWPALDRSAIEKLKKLFFFMRTY